MATSLWIGTTPSLASQKWSSLGIRWNLSIPIIRSESINKRSTDIITEYRSCLKELKSLYSIEGPRKFPLQVDLVRKWFESLVTRAIDDVHLPSNIIEVRQPQVKESFICRLIQVRTKKSGPAFTLLITTTYEGEKVKLDVDLVPVMTFETGFLRGHPRIWSKLQYMGGVRFQMIRVCKPSIMLFRISLQFPKLLGQHSSIKVNGGYHFLFKREQSTCRERATSSLS